MDDQPSTSRHYVKPPERINTDDQPSTSHDYVEPPEEIAPDNFPLVGVNTERLPIRGLSEEENRERIGILNPGENVDPLSRIKPGGFLEIEVNHIQDKIDEVKGLIKREINP